MAAILVDYENTGMQGLEGLDALTEADKLEIFYSKCCTKIRRDQMEHIKESGCEFRIHKLKKALKNGLDFYIASECGRLSMQGEKYIAIISKDKGYQAIIDYFSMNQETSDVQIVKAATFENAFGVLRDNEQRRTAINKRMAPLDLECEFARIEERNRLKHEIEKLLIGTEYEQRSAEIIDFIRPRKKEGMKSVYTGSLHEFGRKDGTAIYQILKQVL